MAGQKITRQQRKILESQNVEDIIEAHGNGESIAKIKKRLGVSTQVWYDWVHSIPGLMDRLREAREAHANDLPYQAMELVDNAEIEEMPKVREQVRTRLWMAERVGSQFKPKQEIDIKGDIVMRHLEALKASPQIVEAEVLGYEDDEDDDEI